MERLCLMPSQIPLELSRAFASGCNALPRAFEEHASCPPVHIFVWDFFHFGCIDASFPSGFTTYTREPAGVS